MAYFRCGGVKKKATQTYTATSRGAALDMGADNEYRYVNTNGVPNSNSGTYVANSRGAALDMGATNTNRYVNTNSVPNTNSGTYTYPANSTGGTYDMGAANTIRYVNAQNVYAKGKADSVSGIQSITDYGAGAAVPSTVVVGYNSRTYEFEAIVPAGSDKCLFSFGGSNTANGVIMLSRSVLRLFAGADILNEGISLDGSRHHYAIVLGNNYVRFYVDKVLKYSYTANATVAMKNASNFVFGRNESYTPQDWSGGTLYKLAITPFSDGTFVL